MIPKLIHYCWFGRGGFNDTVIKCIRSWEKKLPDYSIKLWDEGNSPLNHPYANKMFRQKKWAFVSDYVRLYALYNDGGVYLDTDMQVLKNLDCFLNNKCFLGYEDDVNINGGIIGSVKKHLYIKECLKIYDTIDMPVNIPNILTEVMSNKGFNSEDVKVYTKEVFYPLPWKSVFNNSMIKETSYTIHHWQHSWKPSFKERLFAKISKYLQVTH